MCRASSIGLIGAAFALAACEAEEQPAANEPVANAPVEYEQLPPDESVATGSEELINGVNEPDVGDLGNQH